MELQCFWCDKGFQKWPFALPDWQSKYISSILKLPDLSPGMAGHEDQMAHFVWNPANQNNSEFWCFKMIKQIKITQNYDVSRW